MRRRRLVPEPLRLTLALCALAASCKTVESSQLEAARHALELSATGRSARPAAQQSVSLDPPPDLKNPPATAEQTASGLVSAVLRAGTGDARPRPQDSVRVHYTGWKGDGKLIDSSTTRGGAELFALRGVVQGWAEGLQLMRVGERRRLWIPDHLSYVRAARPQGTSVFDIELLAIVRGESPTPPEALDAPPQEAKKTASGLAYKIMQTGGSGDKPRHSDRVTIDYAGWTTAGELFAVASDSIFDMDKVIPGWSEALQRMGPGDRWRLWVPETLTAGGRAGRPAGPLIYDLTLRSVQRRPGPPAAPKNLRQPPSTATKTPSGLTYQLLSQRSDVTGVKAQLAEPSEKSGIAKARVRPSSDARVRLHYSGWTADGRLFDSSVVRGTPVTVPLSKVIPGWQEGLQHMHVGDRAQLWVPERLAYGGALGAPRGLLVYEVELLEVVSN